MMIFVFISPSNGSFEAHNTIYYIDTTFELSSYFNPRGNCICTVEELITIDITCTVVVLCTALKKREKEDTTF